MRYALFISLISLLQMQKIANIDRIKEDKSIIINPTKPQFSLIWLHGLGDSSSGFESFFKADPSPVFIGGRIKLLNAPSRKVTINYGSVCTSWYDIYSLQPNAKNEDRFNLTQVKESLQIIERHVTSEIEYWRQNGVKGTDEQISKRIFIGGFSQGCAMSLCYGLTSNRLLGGVIGYSGHLFQGLQLKNKDKIPMLVYHGGQDNVLAYKWVKPAYDKYLKPYPNFQFIFIEDLYHSVELEQLVKTTSWISQKLKKNQLKEL